MKKVILLSFALIILIAIGVESQRTDKPAHRPRPVQAPVKVIPKPEQPITVINDCKPNQPTTDQTEAEQQEIIDIVKLIQKEEIKSQNRITPALDALNQEYTELIAKYDTCTPRET